MPIGAGHLTLLEKGTVTMQENQNAQTMSPDQGVIEILAARIGELEKENARLQITVMLKEQENAQLQGDATSASPE